MCDDERALVGIVVIEVRNDLHGNVRFAGAGRAHDERQPGLHARLDALYLPLREANRVLPGTHNLVRCARGSCVGHHLDATHLIPIPITLPSSLIPFHAFRGLAGSREGDSKGWFQVALGESAPIRLHLHARETVAQMRKVQKRVAPVLRCNERIGQPVNGIDV